MYAHFRELLELVLRWMHLIAGIMWIGNSMLFNWLDRNLVKLPDRGPMHEGEIWMVHSGGFYQVEKKQLAPSEIPDQLHWFKWQNGVTWLTGISLLIVVYYMGDSAMMLDERASLAFDNAIALSVGSVIASWLVYHAIWSTSLGQKHEREATWLSLALLLGLIYFFTHVLSGRAAYIHVGVVLGTVMTGNVWFCILPSQTELLAATREGREQDRSIAMRAKQRSIHNNYMTFLVLFIMLSSHFPSTTGNKLNWLVLGVLAVSSAGVRHFMNLRFTYKNWLPPLLTTAFAGACALWALTRPEPMARHTGGARVAFSEAQSIVARRCTACHSQFPSDPVYVVAPNGIMLDTPEQMRRYAERIKARAVVLRTMPLGNKTGITDAERDTLGRWIDQGAVVE